MSDTEKNPQIEETSETAEEQLNTTAPAVEDSTDSKPKATDQNSSDNASDDLQPKSEETKTAEAETAPVVENTDSEPEPTTGTEDDNVVKVEVIEDDDEDDEESEKAGDEDVPALNEEVGETKEPEPVLINYLDPALLSPKTITQDEIEQYSEDEDEETHIDEALEDMYEKSFSDIQEGEVVTGKVVNLTDREVFIDIGFKSEGLVHRSEFTTVPEIGDNIEVLIVSFENRKGQFILSKEKADFLKRWNELREFYETGKTVFGKIVRRIKGGMVVDIDSVLAFLPGSQIDVRPVTDFDDHVGKEYEFKIVKFNELRKNVVLSRKILLESDIKEKRREIISQLEVGMVLEGTVKNITDFGAFVDLGGIDGLLHLTDISWGRINHPSEELAIDQQVTVKVIDFDVEKAHVSLGMKQLQPQPWENAEEKYAVGTEITGTIVNMMKYGVFVELEKGIEGLIHISEMSWTRHIRHPNELFKLGDTVNAKVLSVDPEEKKISLGIKQLTTNPWDDIEKKYPIDSIHTGTVRNLTQFGAFVELEEGIDGLVHVSDMSWVKNVRHPRDLLTKGQEIQVKILDVSRENRRLSLGIKQVQSDPWPELKTIFTAGTIVKGKVILVLDKGIIFQLDHDLEGIVPLKRIAKHERQKIKNTYKPGEEYEVTVQEVDQEYKKVILMMDLPKSGDDDGSRRERPKTKKIKIVNEPASDKLEIPQDILDKLSAADETDPEA
ncbi:MAG: S1 RNA-binding domain-containing protein [FCB group bacterium]|nr:S1 RNA-binding domain-containing protein [FCB group bacterium]